jgi:Hint-domain
VKVEDLKRGMEIETLNGGRVVAAIVRTSIPSGTLPLCNIGGLALTPWHPILVKGQWIFPADISFPKPATCHAIFSVLLVKTADDHPDSHTISIEGVWCTTLGHGIVVGKDTRAHEFLGDYDKVLSDLSDFPGFYDLSGLVDCVGTSRRGSDGVICGFIARELNAPASIRQRHVTEVA